MQKHSTEGEMVTADIWVDNMPDWESLSWICEKALKASNMNVVDRVAHQFKPQGTTAVWILAESHMAIHTYPEENFMAVDVFTCGTEGDPGGVIIALTDHLDMRSLVIKEDKRGQRVHDLGG
tara:strand:+ start:171 stop:536 length:366 start_codon:yes stop_codon:yes gene_type:complete